MTFSVSITHFYRPFCLQIPYNIEHHHSQIYVSSFLTFLIIPVSLCFQQTNSTNKFAVIRAGGNNSSPVGFMKGRVKVRDDIPRPCLIAMPQIHLPGEKHNSEKRFFFRLISRRRRSSNQSGTATLLRNIITSTRRS